MEKFNKSNVLLAPLDWGLGHTTRCIPVIRTLINANYDIVLAVNSKQKKLLQQEFSDIKFIDLSGYNISYANNKFLFFLKIIFQIPKILYCINKENKWLANYLKTNKVDLIISDNRYGFYSKEVKSVFITHQLKIKAGNLFIENIIQNINYRLINKFSSCWVPDFANDNNLAGELSHPKKLPKIPLKYIGTLSRFTKEKSAILYDLCILLSGPEPSRSLLEERILNQLKSINDKKVLLIRGLPNIKEEITLENCTIYNHLRGIELQKAICSSNIILCRSGYTSLMELISMEKKIIAIPTPMQTEQEYLAKYLSRKKWVITANQSNFTLKELLDTAENFIPDFTTTSNNLQYEPLSELL